MKNTYHRNIIYNYENKQNKLPEGMVPCKDADDLGSSLQWGELLNCSTLWWRPGCDLGKSATITYVSFPVWEMRRCSLSCDNCKQKALDKEQNVTILHLEKGRQGTSAPEGTTVQGKSWDTQEWSEQAVCAATAVQEGWFTGQGIGRFKLNTQKGHRSVEQDGHLQHLLWQQCPGHNAEKDNKMTAPKNNSIIQKMSCCFGFFLSISK